MLSIQSKKPQNQIYSAVKPWLEFTLQWGRLQPWIIHCNHRQQHNQATQVATLSIQLWQEVHYLKKRNHIVQYKGFWLESEETSFTQIFVQELSCSLFLENAWSSECFPEVIFANYKQTNQKTTNNTPIWHTLMTESVWETTESGYKQSNTRLQYPA